ncbi:MAG TPA: aminoacyl-tRNA hydrolase [Clostridiales bacterium]|nr:aminoacyl-tRNA hydrolase [Clostridiales bacterium]
MFFKRKNKTEETIAYGPIEYIIAGLGNPGRDYEKTRHNAGFMFADALAEKHNAVFKPSKFKADTADAMINGVRCILVKPMTYMNNSGEAIRDIANFYKIPSEKVIVVYDDTALPTGKLRIRRKGSDGGHNGIKSIIYHLNSDQFPRIKIGIGSKPHPDFDLKDYVLSVFTKEDLELILPCIDRALEAINIMVTGDIDMAMSKYSG